MQRLGVYVQFDWTDEQLKFRQAVIRFAERELAKDVLARDRDGAFSAQDWKRCADFGFQGLAVPEVYGGSGADFLTTIVALEALGYACRDNGLIFSLNAQMWACQYPILRFGTDEQRQRYLPSLVDGSMIGAHAMTEPESGSDAFSLTTSAIRYEDGYLLRGSKTFVTNAPAADVFVVFATTEPGTGFSRLCAFLVDRGTPGLTVASPIDKMGLRTSPMSELFFDDAPVSARQMLGKPHAGMAIFNASMETERSLILACVIGTMERSLERSTEYARQRKQFGQSISKFQAVSHRLVDMKLRLETARLLLYKVGWLMDCGRPSSLESALAKLHLSESFLASSLDAVQVHGGYGYMREYEFERDVRDAIGSRLYSGTSEMQRNIAARAMRL